MNELDQLSKYIIHNKIDIDSDLFTNDTIKNISVYKSNYKNSLKEALRKKYPTIIKVLGPNFDYVANRFIEDTKSSNYNLDDYGNGLNVFLKSIEQLKRLPVVEHLATIDLILFERNLDSETIMPKGSLKAWKDINQDILDSVSINENETESIKLKLSNNTYYLVSN